MVVHLLSLSATRAPYIAVDSPHLTQRHLRRLAGQAACVKANVRRGGGTDVCVEEDAYRPWGTDLGDEVEREGPSSGG